MSSSVCQAYSVWLHVLTGPDANYAPARGGSESRNLAPLERLETRLEVETGFKQLLFEPKTAPRIRSSHPLRNDPTMSSEES